MITVIGMGLAAAAALGSAAFIGLYSWYVRWWRSEVGWHLVSFPAVLLLLALNAVAVRALGDYLGRQVVTLALFGVWVAVVWWRLALLIRTNTKEPLMRIIPRAAWGARHDNGGGPAPLPAGEVWLHHSAGLWPDLPWIDADRDGVEDDEERAMRGLEDIGEQRFGRGISYSLVIMPSGRIYEGHGMDRLGSHTGGRNSVARAICWAGNYEINRPTVAQIWSTAWALQEGVRRRWWRTPKFRGGHRDVLPMTGDSIATACPGDHAYAVIAEINRLAAGPPITSLEDDMQLTDKIRLWEPDGDKEYDVAAAFYGSHFHAKNADIRAARIEAKLDALAGSLSDDEANIVAATRQIIADDPDAEVRFTPEMAQLFADRVLAQLPEQVRGAVREAFARAGQE